MSKRTSKRKAAEEPLQDDRQTKSARQRNSDSHLCCPITMDVMEDPVMAADNRTYDRSAIKKWLGEKSISPITGLELRDRVLRTNWAMRDSLTAAGYNVLEGVVEEEEVTSDVGFVGSSSSSSLAAANGMSTPTWFSSGLSTPHGAGLHTPPGMGMSTPTWLFSGLSTPHGAGLLTPPSMGLSTPPGVGLRTPTGMGLATPPGTGLHTPTGMHTPLGLGGLSTPRGAGTHTPNGTGTPDGIRTPTGMRTPLGFGGLSTPLGGLRTPSGMSTPNGMRTPIGHGGLSTPRYSGMRGPHASSGVSRSQISRPCTCRTELSPSWCLAVEHHCSCIEHPLDCRAQQGHYCTCKSLGGTGTIFCKASNHSCLCRDFRQVSCKAGWYDHECICSHASGAFQDCWAWSEHSCICTASSPSTCKARDHSCLCREPSGRSRCRAGWYDHHCTCLSTGSWDCWAFVHSSASSASSSNSQGNWRRMESRSQPGVYYYFNQQSGISQSEPPPPWERRTSRRNADVTYYWNPVTGDTSTEKPVI